MIIARPHPTRVAGLCLAALLAPGLAFAQQGSASPGDATIEIAPLPEWSIRSEVDQLDVSMREYSSLIKSLSRASDDLGAEFEKYLKDPHNELLASSVEKKMAVYAKTVMADFNDIIADQDVLGSNFRELQRKLVNFSGHLGTQARGFKLRLDSYRTQAREHEKRLMELSVQIREDPPADAEALKKLKQEFARELRRYRLQGRYVSGYQRRYKSYQALQRNMRTLASLFVNLHEKFNELIENLENERQYLHDSLRLQADTLRIRQIIRDGILGSEQAIGNVADKLANLYNKVDAFSRVHERINSDLNRFVESQGALMDVTRRIEDIGTQGGPIGNLAGDLDKAIDTFYDRRNEGDSETLLIEEAAAKAAAEEAAKAKAARDAAARRSAAPPPAAPPPAPAPQEPAGSNTLRPVPESDPAPSPDAAKNGQGGNL